MTNWTESEQRSGQRPLTPAAANAERALLALTGHRETIELWAPASNGTMHCYSIVAPPGKGYERRQASGPRVGRANGYWLLCRPGRRVVVSNDLDLTDLMMRRELPEPPPLHGAVAYEVSVDWKRIEQSIQGPTRRTRGRRSRRYSVHRPWPAAYNGVIMGLIYSDRVPGPFFERSVRRVWRQAARAVRTRERHMARC